MLRLLLVAVASGEAATLVYFMVLKAMSEAPLCTEEAISYNRLVFRGST